ncbi:lens fiber membrane intrinsic protein-like [Varanus komodoensis]|uniref:lens fiber membrane intrinsic protein-like n=1 Tax=Varanus komodoensis TaxID=61221 RepID=UPI001CF7EC61|nr:lens fiber membrane intrinsic protein-like [Varanus komodoensis]
MATINVLHVVAVASSLISLLILLIALGSDYWATAGAFSQGLWNICDGTTCVKLQVSSVALNTVRAFVLLAMITSVVACCCLCAGFWLKQVGSVSMAMMAATANVVAGLFTMIGMSVFTGRSEQSVFFGWSFGFGWSCFPLFLICGGIAYTLKMDTSA